MQICDVFVAVAVVVPTSAKTSPQNVTLQYRNSMSFMSYDVGEGTNSFRVKIENERFTFCDFTSLIVVQSTGSVCSKAPFTRAIFPCQVCFNKEKLLA